MLTTPPITLAICANFLPEATVLVKRNEMKNITLIPWEATCRRSLTSWDDVMSLVEQADTPTNPLVIIGSCFSRPIGSVPEDLNHVHFEQLDHCFDLICSKEMVTDLIKEGAYLVSSGWLTNWRQTLDAWGFDQRLAEQFFHETATKIVLLDTEIAPEAETDLQSFATYISLPVHQIRVGLDHFFWRISSLVSSVRAEHQQQRLLLNEEKLAQYELSLSLLDSLTDSKTKQEAVSGLIETFYTLFAPQYVQFHQHLQPSSGIGEGTSMPEILSAEMLHRLHKNHYLRHESQDGFWIVLRNGSVIVGYLNISKVQISKYLPRYLNLALALAPLCALAISRGQFAEQRQKDMAALQLKNEELEQFVDVVSHDLKSPLVTISSFMTMLQQDIATNNPELVAKDINFIRGAIDKMDLLLNALLNLSSTGRQEFKHQRISLQSVIDSSLIAVAGSVQQYGINIVVKHQGLQLVGDPLQLGQIWQNLIENSIKYRGTHPSPTIKIGVIDNQSGPEFYVCDNGIGIAPKHVERVFGIFSQLNPSSDGCGLGLALVKKIVERYQGSIRVESEGSGKGSCFYFTLPEALIKGNKTI